MRLPSMVNRDTKAGSDDYHLSPLYRVVSMLRLSSGLRLMLLEEAHVS